VIYARRMCWCKRWMWKARSWLPKWRISVSQCPSMSASQRAKADEQLPLRWCAPEVMVAGGQFSEASGVWSCGVLLWEVFTRCVDVRSYCQVTADVVEVYTRLQHADCPMAVTALVNRCWQWEANAMDRPTMAKIAEQLQAAQRVAPLTRPIPTPATAGVGKSKAVQPSTTEICADAVSLSAKELNQISNVRKAEGLRYGLNGQAKNATDAFRVFARPSRRSSCGGAHDTRSTGHEAERIEGRRDAGDTGATIGR
jgi:hypothetical protein